MTDLPRRRQQRAASGPSPVRHGALPRRRALTAAAKILAAVIAVALVSVGSVAAYAVWDVAHSVKSGVHLSTLPGQEAQGSKDLSAIKGGVNLLLAGTDTRSGLGGAYNSAAEQASSTGAGNNDVTMLLHIAQDHKSMMVVSIPRDLMVTIPDCPSPDGSGTVAGSPSDQFNTTLSRGGLGCVVLTVEKLTGVNIPFGAVINFNGVSAMSNAIGGVTVCLATPVTDAYTNPPLNLPAGQNTLVGDQALSFLRSRHGVGDGSDLGRISNQQVFLSALARKVVSGGVLSNPVQLYGLAKAAVQNITPSDTLTNPSTLVQIALALKDTGLQHMVFLQYPAAADPDNPNRVVPDPNAAPAINEALVKDKPVTLTGSTGRAAEDPHATPTPSPSMPTAPSTSGSSSSPSAPSGSASSSSAPASPSTPAPTNSGPVDLPSTVTGQTAAQQTCTKGNN